MRCRVDLYSKYEICVWKLETYKYRNIKGYFDTWWVCGQYSFHRQDDAVALTVIFFSNNL